MTQEDNLSYIISNEYKIVNRLCLNIKKIILDNILLRDNNLTDILSVSDSYSDMSQGGTGVYELDVFAPETTEIGKRYSPRFSVSFHFDYKDDLLQSDTVFYDIIDSTVDNSSIKDNFGVWFGEAWNWNTMSINRDFMHSVLLKFESYLDNVSSLEEK